MRTDLPGGTVTLLFTDIEGSTRLLHALGPAEYAAVLAEHRRVLREAFAAHGGVEVDTQGDAFFVAFPTAEGAGRAALGAQQALASSPIAVRMGVHTGTPTLSGEGYVGIDVHRGARVAALAHGGQIVLSPTAATLVEGHPLRDLGQHRLKDFDGSTRLWQLGDGDFPPLRTPGSVNLPTPATRFLGREQELFDAVSLVLERDPRVLTIIGPGGAGKTRFALELCRLLAEEADGGTVFVPLAPLRDPELAVPTLAELLGAAAPDPASIAARVGDRRTHALCDNAEHLLPGAARTLAEVAAATPALRLVVTSREPLRISGEVELDLSPLGEEEAVTLFLERAHAVRPGLEPDEAVAELCRRLDRLPLALELAAARTKLLAPQALLERLGASLDVLQGTRDADERHTTLRTTIAWSYDLLNDDEQRLFRRLAVFRGGCTLESAEAVCDAELDTLGSLLDKSLLRRRSGRLGEERFWMLETIREFALEQLEALDEAHELRRRHAERMLSIARSTHLSEDDDEPFDFDTALAEREDLRGALDWAAERDPVLGLELAVELETFLAGHAPDEGMRRLEALLDGGTDAPPQVRGRALRALGGCAHQLGRFDVADPAYEQSLRIFTELGDDRGMASLWIRLAARAFERGDLDLTRSYVEECERVARDRFRVVEAQASTYAGRLAVRAGDLESAESHLSRSRGLAASLGWTWWEANSLTLLLDVALRRQALDEAERRGRSALTIYAGLESRAWALNALSGLAQVALARGELERAGVFWGAASAEGEPTSGWDLRKVVWGGELLGEDRPRFLDGVARGRELDFWDAVAIALGEDGLQTEP